MLSNAMHNLYKILGGSIIRSIIYPRQRRRYSKHRSNKSYKLTRDIMNGNFIESFWYQILLK